MEYSIHRKNAFGEMVEVEVGKNKEQRSEATSYDGGSGEFGPDFAIKPGLLAASGRTCLLPTRCVFKVCWLSLIVIAHPWKWCRIRNKLWVEGACGY
jgi:hypothetical protein